MFNPSDMLNTAQIFMICLIALAILFLMLNIRIIALRYRFKVGLGSQASTEEDTKQLTRAVRSQANFVEYVPFILLISFAALVPLILVQKQILMHFILIPLVIGRYTHAYAFFMPVERLIFRQIGMMLTFFSLIIATAVLVYALITMV